MENKSKYLIIPEGTYILNTADNSTIEVQGQDLINVYLYVKGHI
jgi:hypothetical protein